VRWATNPSGRRVSAAPTSRNSASEIAVLPRSYLPELGARSDQRPSSQSALLGRKLRPASNSSFRCAWNAALMSVDLALGDQIVGNQPFGIKLQRRLVLLDPLVHPRLGEHRLVAFIVPEPAIAEDVDDDVLVELLAKFGRHLGGMDHRLGVVAIDVKDRRLDHQCDIGGIGRGSRIVRRGGEPDLVVHHQMDGAAGPVAAQTRQAKALGDNALAGKGGVAMQQHRQDPGSVGVAGLVLLGARLAQHDGVHRLQMAGVCGQRQVHRIAVEFAVRRGAQMVFHIARPFDILGLEAAALEFVEDRAIGLAHHIGEHRQPAAMRHADHQLGHPQRAAALDDLFHRRDQRLATVKAEPLGAGVFDMQELFEAFGLDQLVQDRPAPRG
jgi:hypothetical protein